MDEHKALAGLLKQAILNDLNVLMEGRHGTGKTQVALQVVKELGLRYNYYSAPTLDPFVDFVGLPVPVTNEDGYCDIHYHRLQSLMKAEVLLFDELNRGHEKTKNAVLEIILFKTINGDPLPNLKCVLSMINPIDDDVYDYQVSELDPVLIDRFKIHIVFPTNPSRLWFKKQYGDLGGKLVDWWNTLADEEKKKVSPRKLDNIGELIELGIDPSRAVHPSYVLPWDKLDRRLKGEDVDITIEDFVGSPGTYVNLLQSENGEVMHIATSFSRLVRVMRVEQQYTCHEIILALPSDTLAELKTGAPFVIKNITQQMKEQEGEENAAAFQELVEEKIG